ncbi:selenide, water dikinase SelD [Streptomyces uncialis]|uniref:Selenide, water dikinase n=1 Tax=Streptomyces uncialis TaxID=1048205 RepID=A0A1Q4V8G7_9ACTN|nr:selenide, water dikinase SelD [Streptomyces uncialis]MCX4662000.1 selenide, water dikinase SelD [Streptomyces uncialis]OKH94141.1 segregation protein A [Streptomyces uncialis]
MDDIRMTRYGRGGGCACKIPPGELETLLKGLTDDARAGDAGELLVGPEHGDDAAVVRLGPGLAAISTADFFTPVVDDPYTWGRIAATNAMSDVYAMGGTPVMAVNLLAWPRETLPMEIAREVLRGGLDAARAAGCPVAGGHSIDSPDPLYGMAVTGTADPARLITLDRAEPGRPLTLTKPLGVGVLNTLHKATGEVFPEAVEVMTTLNRDASAAATARGIRAGTDVTGFGLLGHAHRMARASGVTLAIDADRVPVLAAARSAVAAGHISGGSRRNLDWVAPHGDLSAADEATALLLADAQTSGGLLLAGELPGHPVIGEVLPFQGSTVLLR